MRPFNWIKKIDHYQQVPNLTRTINQMKGKRVPNLTGNIKQVSCEHVSNLTRTIHQDVQKDPNPIRSMTFYNSNWNSRNSEKPVVQKCDKPSSFNDPDVETVNFLSNRWKNVLNNNKGSVIRFDSNISVDPDDHPIYQDRNTSVQWAGEHRKYIPTKPYRTRVFFSSRARRWQY